MCPSFLLILPVDNGDAVSAGGGAEKRIPAVAEILPAIRSGTGIAENLLAVFRENETADIVVIVGLIVMSALGGKTVERSLFDQPLGYGGIICAVILRVLAWQCLIEPQECAQVQSPAATGIIAVAECLGRKMDVVGELFFQIME